MLLRISICSLLTAFPDARGRTAPAEGPPVAEVPVAGDDASSPTPDGEQAEPPSPDADADADAATSGAQPEAVEGDAPKDEADAPATGGGAGAEQGGVTEDPDASAVEATTRSEAPERPEGNGVAGSASSAPNGPRIDSEANPTADAPAFAPQFGKRQRVVFGVVGGVLTLAGAGLAGVSVYSMLQGKQVRDDLDAMLDADPDYLVPTDAAALEARLQMRADAIAEGRRHNRMAIATGISGGIAFGTGVAMVILGVRKPHKTQLSPIFGRRTAGLVLRRSF